MSGSARGGSEWRTRISANTCDSDNIGKNTGDKETVEKVKHELGYVEKAWEGGDETARWGRDEDAPKS